VKATGIVRRIDDLGRVVIPKEIRRTLRIREGDPLEIYTDHEGEVIFKKYSPMGELSSYAVGLCETINKTVGLSCIVCDRDTVVSAAGPVKRDVADKRISEDLERLMEERQLYHKSPGSRLIPVCAGMSQPHVLSAAPIISEGDMSGSVCFISDSPDDVADDTAVKIVQTVSAFLGKQMES